MDSYFTFLYVRSGNAGVRSIRIHRAVALILLFAFISLVLTSVVIVAKYSGMMSDARRLADLERENQALLAKIKGFETKIERFTEQLNTGLELQNRSRLLAGLKPLSGDVWEVGIGGPQPLEAELDVTSADLFIAELEGDLDKMARQAGLLLENYEETIAILSEEKKIRDCTPSIRPLKGGYLSSRFGRRMDPFTGRISHHLGVDYTARIGTPVISTADGIISMAKKKGSFGK